MSESSIFGRLVRSELKWGGWMGRKRKSERIPKKWWIFYALFIALVFSGFATYAALHGNFRLENIWFFTLGFPYVMLPFGSRAIKREWENNTEGWWLTLPYSRQQLIGAKFVAAWLKLLVIIAITYILSFLFAAYLTILPTPYHLHDMMNFLLVGLGWYILLFGLSPFMVSFGILLAMIKYTIWKPVIAILIVFNFVSASFLYSALWTWGGKGSIYLEFSGQATPTLLPYPITILYLIFACWILTYFILRLSAYLLEKKLTL